MDGHKVNGLTITPDLAFAMSAQKLDLVLIQRKSKEVKACPAINVIILADQDSSIGHIVSQ